MKTLSFTLAIISANALKLTSRVRIKEFKTDPHFSRIDPEQYMEEHTEFAELAMGELNNIVTGLQNETNGTDETLLALIEYHNEKQNMLETGHAYGEFEDKIEQMRGDFEIEYTD